MKDQINTLIELTRKINQLDISNEIQFWQHLFSSARKLMPKADYGAFFMFVDGRVKFMDAVGHDLPLLKTLDIPDYMFLNENRKNKVLRDPDIVQRSNDQAYFDGLVAASKPIKETMTFNFYLNDYPIAGMALDIGEGTEALFNEEDEAILTLFMTLAETFYELKYEKAKFEQLFNHANAGILLLSNENKVIEANPTFTDIFAYNKEEIIGEDVDDLILPKDRQDEGRLYSMDALKGKPVRFESIRQTKTGQAVDVFVNAFPVKLNKDQVGVYGIYYDISQRKDQERHIEYLSLHDELTGLYNRRYFANELDRYNQSRILPITVVMGDLNKLKKINDTYGHKVGDDYIKKIAKILKESIRSEDVAARLGGDEFALILPGLDESQAERVLKRIQAGCQRASQNQPYAIPLAISLGAETQKDKAVSLEAALSQADKKMYRHKRQIICE